MKVNSKLWFILISLVVIIISGCNVPTVKYQCSNGQVVDSLTSCPNESNAQTEQSTDDSIEQWKESFRQFKLELETGDSRGLSGLNVNWIVYEYNQNPLTADNDYKNKYGLFYGYLVAIGRFDDGTVYAQFEGDTSTLGEKYNAEDFICYALNEQELLLFKKGDWVKFIGVVLGQQSNVYAYCSYFEKYES